jgi:DNA-binding transcriptional LysR family regulator
MTVTQSILDIKWFLFLKVADIGSISGAALSLDMPVSVVSRHISKLEKDVGTRLFSRTGRGMVLTEFGHKAYPRIMELIRDAEQLIDDMQATSSIPMGNVRFGMPSSVVPVLVDSLVTTVRKSWPKVRLHLTEGSSSQLEEWLAQGRLDMALLVREEDALSTGEKVLIRLPLYLVVPASDDLAGRESVSFEEIAELPLVLPSEPHPLRTALTKLARKKNLSLTEVVEANSIRLQHEIVNCKGGYTITAGTFTTDERKTLKRIPIVNPSMSRVVVLAVTSHRAHTRATYEVGRLLQAMAPALLKAFSEGSSA